jgi:CRISPR/Cas system endoribonuclease Cas6 (RAMP superfamily)
MDDYRKLESTSTLNSFTLSSSGIISLRRTCKKMKRIYFDFDNSAFIAWLKTRPTDTYDVLLGSDMPDESVDLVFSKVAKEGVDLAQWLVGKLKAGEMQVKIAAKLDLPQGIVLE